MKTAPETYSEQVAKKTVQVEQLVEAIESTHPAKQLREYADGLTVKFDREAAETRLGHRASDDAWSRACQRIAKLYADL